MQQLVELQDLYPEFESRAVEIIAVSNEEKNFMAHTKVIGQLGERPPYPILCDAKRKHTTAYERTTAYLVERDGTIAGATHAPRGMLEFWVDPDSPYFREKLNDESKQYLLFCASAWRSALATDRLTEMGMENVSHIEGGLTGWKEADGPVETREKKG